MQVDRVQYRDCDLVSTDFGYYLLLPPHRRISIAKNQSRVTATKSIEPAISRTLSEVFACRGK
jgi:hypothetical protein